MNQVSATTLGIKVSVIPRYHEDLSKPSLFKFVHSYRVTITNLSGLEVQLMTRKWIITDANGKVRNVEGPGVIGEQPVLDHNESHSYTSWCPLSTPVGKMGGSYGMVRTADNSQFDIEIPTFRLIADFKMN